MNEQEQLFGVQIVGVDHDHALARFTDPTTSHIADAVLRQREGSADEIRPRTHRHRALACFVNGPLIAEDVKFITGIDGIWKRVSDLKNNGFIQRTGFTKRSREGREADLYELTEKGRAALAALGPIKETP